MLLFPRFRGHPAPAFCDPVMAITTDSTQPSAGKLSADSTSLDPEAAVRVARPQTGSGGRDSSAITFSGERPNRLRPATSASLHERITADRQPPSSTEPGRKMAPVEFRRALPDFYAAR